MPAIVIEAVDIADSHPDAMSRPGQHHGSRHCCAWTREQSENAISPPLGYRSGVALDGVLDRRVGSAPLHLGVGLTQLHPTFGRSDHVEREDRSADGAAHGIGPGRAHVSTPVLADTFGISVGSKLQLKMRISPSSSGRTV
jgi:hypothetical protein